MTRLGLALAATATPAGTTPPTTTANGTVGARAAAAASARSGRGRGGRSPAGAAGAPGPALPLHRPAPARRGADAGERGAPRAGPAGPSASPRRRRATGEPVRGGGACPRVPDAPRRPPGTPPRPCFWFRPSLARAPRAPLEAVPVGSGGRGLRDKGAGARRGAGLYLLRGRVKPAKVRRRVTPGVGWPRKETGVQKGAVVPGRSHSESCPDRSVELGSECDPVSPIGPWSDLQGAQLLSCVDFVAKHQRDTSRGPYV